MTPKQIMKTTLRNERLAKIVELCREPNMTCQIIAKTINADHKVINYDLWRLRQEDNPFIRCVIRGVKVGRVWQAIFITIRECAYIPYIPGEGQVERFTPPDDPVCARLMGYNTLEPQSASHVYRADDFNALKRKHNGIWNPDTGNRQVRNAVSGSTLSMVV